MAAVSFDTPFHPAVSTWLVRRFGQPTEVQAQAWAVTSQRRHALIAAPTGSGKTLAAFLSAIDELVKEGLAQGLSDEVHVLYVSPLKALSNDIRKNLQEPLAGIAAELATQGLPDVGIRAAVRTGDTPSAERERMRRQPPHILVTTPESLYILLSSDSGRAMLKSVKSVIIDELHAVAGSKRGSHLMLSLERLEALCATPPVRIGLSATVKPLDDMARFLVGQHGQAQIVDTGHVRERDLALEVPRSPLTSVMATEVWGELYDRLAELVAQHRTTLIFVNQRRVAERVARHLAERIGEAHVTAHHGSLAREHRLDAEQRLKAGELKALVATSSLELGIDIGDIDLVCQMGSPRAVNAFLQRVGRAGHAIGAIPKGRLFPLSLDDLLECTALLHAVAHDELDRIRVPDKPLDALAQQIVAEVGCQDWPLDALYEQFRHAQPYRDLTLVEFEDVVQMLADGYTTRRGRRGAYLHFDAVNRVLRARRGARLAAVTNAGVIPDQFDYEVVLQPDGHRVGTLNEDFAFESLPGDIFQLGNTSYRIAKVETGKVLVEDAHGQPPTMPFWLGESLGRTEELSLAVSRLSETADALLAEGGQEACERWLHGDLQLQPAAAYQLALYLAASKAALGSLPTREHIVLERFFDEVGDTHLVIHSPYGSRINRAWGLSLRKRMCRKFNFELQASALEDSIVLSLGPTHSFPLEEIAHYLKAASAHDVLVQALLEAPLFGTRWRWNATAALAVRRMNGGRKVPPQFQRSDAEDLLTVVFPDQVACAENLVGEREIPHHPLVDQTLRDCLEESMDAAGFVRLLARMELGEVQVTARDLASPSPLAHAILNAKPYAFLDGGAAEERRTKAVATKPLMDVQTAEDIGKLDPAVIAQVREDAWPEIRDAEELHDALVVHGFLTIAEAPRGGAAEATHNDFALALAKQRRITRLQMPGGSLLYVAAERLHEFQAVFPQVLMSPPIAATNRSPVSPDDALREIVRGRLELLGPVTVEALAAPLELEAGTVLMALLQLEAEGAVMRGAFSAAGAQEWCDRRLLARIHRGTRDKLRAEFSPVAPAQFMRFLFRWHQLAGSEGVAHVPGAGDERRQGEAGLADVLHQLEGHAASASAWEDDLLPARVADYQPPMLDKLCASGRVAWWRPTEAGTSDRKSGPIRATPVMLCERDALPYWQQAAGALQAGADNVPAATANDSALSSPAQQVLAVLRTHGASFFADLRRDARQLGTQTEQALAELVAHGLVTCDSFAGLRTLVMPEDKRNKLRRKRGVLNGAALDPMDDAGRWSLVRRVQPPETPPGALAAPHVEHVARVLLRRYGVVFRKLLEREDGLPPWRELFYVLRRLEARGEVRGGRFVSGFSGEQFALPEAATALRRIAKTPGTERVAVAATDPLNLAGILTPGDKLARVAGNRVLFEGGVPVAVQAGGELRYLREFNAAEQWQLKNLLVRRHMTLVAPPTVTPEPEPAEALQATLP